MKKFRSKRFRDSYVDANVRMFLAQQVRALRGDMSQEEFANVLGTTQSVVSRYEDPSYGKFNLQTLLEIAAKLNRAVFARIVDFPTFLRLTEDISEGAQCPEEYDEEVLDRLVSDDADILLELVTTGSVLVKIPPSRTRERDSLEFTANTGGATWLM